MIILTKMNLFIFFILFFSCSSIPLKFKLRETEFKTYETNICLGTPKKCDYYTLSFNKNNLISFGEQSCSLNTTKPPGLNTRLTSFKNT